MNRSLKGYTVRIGALDFHPIGSSLDLDDIRLVRTDRAGSTGGHHCTLDGEPSLEGAACPDVW